MELLLDFVNLKERTLDRVYEYCRKHRLFATMAGEKDGVDGFFCTKQKPEAFFWYEEIPLAREATRCSPATNILPGDNRVHEIGPLLQKSQAEYADFLDSCIAGKPQFIEFFNERATRIEHCNKLDSTSDVWTPTTNLFMDPKNLEDMIDVHSIIYPLWRGEGRNFSRVKKCRECGNYFFAPNKKREFCEAKCRHAWNYKNSKEETFDMVN